MTVSNLYKSNNPLENPLNVGSIEKVKHFGGINRGQTGNSKDLSLPDPIMCSEIGRSCLKVPNQDISLGDQLNGNGFIPGYESLFRLSDGTILDFKTGKIIFQENPNKNGFWGDPDRVITFRSNESNDWHNDSFEDIMNGNNSCDKIDPASAKYWLQAQEEADALISSMTDYQKKLISNFESHFPKSRLIEESKKSTI